MFRVDSLSDHPSPDQAHGLQAAPQRLGTSRPTAQAAVAEVGQAALSGTDLDDLFDLALDLTCAVLDVEFATILKLVTTGDSLVLVAGRGWGDTVQIGSTTVPIDVGSQAGFTLLSSEPVIVENWASEKRFARPELLNGHEITSGITVMIQDTRGPCGVLGAHARTERRFTAEDSDFLRSVANIIGSAVENQLAREHIAQQALMTERRLRYHEALGRCARALLANTGDNRLEEAVEALLDATQSTYVFVERNYMDPELGFCSRTVAEMESAHDGVGLQMENPYWAKVPWERMPTSRSFLERGEPCVILPDELVGIERELYASDPIPVKAELDIPIFVGGEWEGLIGFSDTVVTTDWTDEDLSLLSTAATMIGAFWEREQSREHLEQIIRSKDEFLASISHELRTPLTAVVGFNEILRDSKDMLSIEEREDLLETVVRQGTDLTNIVNDLLVAARADIGKLHVALVSIDVRAQAAQVLEAFSGDGIADLTVTGEASRAIGDPDRARQIVRNLVSNAIRYGGGDIRVDVSSNDDGVAVRVSDSGNPIPSSDRERIFEAYQRAHDAKGVTGSIGLGLAISRQLARLMGGDVTYTHDGGRNIFELNLPLAT